MATERTLDFDFLIPFLKRYMNKESKPRFVRKENGNYVFSALVKEANGFVRRDLIAELREASDYEFGLHELRAIYCMAAAGAISLSKNPVEKGALKREIDYKRKWSVQEALFTDASTGSIRPADWSYLAWTGDFSIEEAGLIDKKEFNWGLHWCLLKVYDQSKRFCPVFSGSYELNTLAIHNFLRQCDEWGTRFIGGRFGGSLDFSSLSPGSANLCFVINHEYANNFERSLALTCGCAGFHCVNLADASVDGIPPAMTSTEMSMVSSLAKKGIYDRSWLTLISQDQILVGLFSALASSLKEGHTSLQEVFDGIQIF